jgi:hypothetical protein
MHTSICGRRQLSTKAEVGIITGENSIDHGEGTGMLTGGNGGEDKDGTDVLMDGDVGEDKDGTGMLTGGDVGEDKDGTDVEGIGASITPDGNVGGAMVAPVTEDGGGCAVNIPADSAPVTGGVRIVADKGGGP